MFATILSRLTSFFVGSKIQLILLGLVAVALLGGTWSVKTIYTNLQALEEKYAVLDDQHKTTLADNKRLKTTVDENKAELKKRDQQSYQEKTELAEKAAQRLALVQSLNNKIHYLQKIKRPSNEKDCPVHPAIITAFDVLYPKNTTTGPTVSGAGKGG